MSSSSGTPKEISDMKRVMMREHLIPQWPEILHKTLIKKTASNNEGMEEKYS